MVRLQTFLTVTGLVIGVAVFVQVAQESLSYWHWGDEDEKIVAAWMISEGYRVYDTLFAHHGALNYALAHFVYEATGALDLPPYRLLNWATVALAGLALAASPLLAGWKRRAVASVLFCALAALLSPLWYGHTLLYHSLGGVTMSIGLSLLLVPAMFDIDPGKLRAFAGGAALAAAGFAAYPLAVPILLLTLAVLLFLRARGGRWQDWRRTALMAIAGGTLCSALMLYWLWRFGDIVGYGIYHIWFNQAVYTQFIDFDLGGVWRQLGRLFKSPLGWAVWFSLLFSFLVMHAALTSGKQLEPAQRGVRRYLWIALGWAMLLSGLLFLNPRGEEVYKNAPLWIVGIGLLSLMICLPRSSQATVSSPAAVRWLAIGLAVATPVYLGYWTEWKDVQARYVSTHYAEEQQESYAEQVSLAQALVPPDKPILAVVFAPRWYLLAQRFPASGAYYYLPWQAAYNRAPMRGYRIDPCADLASDPPKVIAWDRWKVWDEYDVADYEPCLVEIMQRHYVAIRGTQLLLRKPVRPDDVALVTDAGFKLESVVAAP